MTMSVLDTDNDGTPDECDLDDDNDGVLDEDDNCPLVVNVSQLDSDEGMPDGVGDACVCPEVNDPEQIDLDGDGEGCM